MVSKKASKRKHPRTSSASHKRTKASSTSKKRSSYDQNTIVALLSIIVIVVALGVMIYFAVSSSPTLEKKPFSHSTIDYDFSVSQEVGFVLDSDMLHFGGAPPGAKLKRGLEINSSRDARVLIVWEGPGDISVDKNNFTIDAGNNTEVIFTLKVPDTLSTGEYDGEIIIDLYEQE
ncbi:MAG: hypothetical protein ACQESE_05380 [Nanobdellota archaeon]